MTEAERDEVRADEAGNERCLLGDRPDDDQSQQGKREHDCRPEGGPASRACHERRVLPNAAAFVA